MKKSCVISAAALTALAAAGVARFETMSVKKRADMCSGAFVKVLSSFGKKLPEIQTESRPEKEGEKLFYPGSGEFLNKPAKNSHWYLGYSEQSILPPDINKKQYCIAGNTRLPANFAAGVLDDVKVRTIVLDDNSGRGAVSFSVVDCIGISNKDIREIRRRLSRFASDNNFSAIIVSATHTHSGIDTQGIWGPIVDVYKNNRKALKTGKGEIKDSRDAEYIDFVMETVKATVEKAYADKTRGRLFKAYMGKNSQCFMNENKSGNITDRGLSGFVWDRRPPKDCSTQLLRLRFVPDDKSKKETLILNFGAHPYINSMKLPGVGNGDMISGDFVYSLCDTVEKSGKNALYINGAVAAVYPARLYSSRLPLAGQAKAVGNEIARVALAMTKTEKEIYGCDITNPDIYEKQLGFGDGTTSAYSAWLKKKGGDTVKETEIEPIINLRIKQVPLKVDNPIFNLIGKIKIGNFNIEANGDGQLSSFTEVGYLELGNGTVKAALVPGELEPAVLSGSFEAKGEYSYSGDDFSQTPLSFSAGDSELTVFGLTNDAIGYIIPDNDFSMMFLGSGKRMQKLFGAHYLEIFSFGKYTAASVAKAFGEIIDETKGTEK